MSLFAEIRGAAAEVTRRARSVAIDDEALARLADAFAAERPALPGVDPAHQRLGGAAETLAFVVTLNAINFGSGWFPVLRKRAGLSGYLSVAGALRERFEAEGPWSARELAALTEADCARLFGQQGNAPAAELMALFARALAELGHFLVEGFGGRFEGPLEEAAGSAERLVAPPRADALLPRRVALRRARGALLQARPDHLRRPRPRLRGPRPGRLRATSPS